MKWFVFVICLGVGISRAVVTGEEQRLIGWVVIACFLFFVLECKERKRNA